jgi:phospholipid/cholesterol/gamma-HCH transport system ATP-binding protein
MDEKEVYRIRNKFGFLFQSSALFDSMTVGENVGLGLKENTDTPQEKIDNIVVEKLSLVNLEGTEDLMPSELSGGMRKRVGLARALACSPEYILYDEPTTGLDPITSETIDQLIGSLARNEKLQVTSIIVTHDIFSVYEVADTVAMMYEGVIHFEVRNELKTTNDPIVKSFRTDRPG